MPPSSRSRFLVPDLAPGEREELKGMRARLLFVAESPHVSEIEPEAIEERRPLCGMAGRKWWSTLGEFLEGDPSEDVSLSRMIALCGRHRIAVMNAVQYPLDSAIVRVAPGADPLKTVGFSKNSGPDFYKKKKNTPAMARALESLRARLCAPELAEAPIHCLGNDSLWLVEQALGREQARARLRERIYHPSAWWRQGGQLGRVARSRLREILSS